MVDRYLEVHKLQVIPRIAGFLPPDIACRYCVLPLAKDGECFTVAMANPDDLEARQAVSAILGSSTCVVRADGRLIYRLLAELWPGHASRSMSVLAWLSQSASSRGIEEYVSSLAKSIGACLQIHEVNQAESKLCEEMAAEVEHQSADLMICAGLTRPFLQRLIRGPLRNEIIDRLPISTLFMEQAEWPVKNILMVLWNEPADEPAVEWTILFARRLGAPVTVLPVGSYVPPLYTGQTAQISSVLTAKSSLGRHVRAVAQRLVDWDVQAYLHMRQGEPCWQVRHEIVERTYDLIVLGAGSRRGLERWLCVDLIATTLHWTQQPILVAK
jgi:nucleotide-binding universal stress UspA family protein